MGITADGWLDWAIRDPGPADKVYSQGNTIECYLPHDAVGYRNGWNSRLFSRERLPDGRYTEYAATSQHGIILDEIDQRFTDGRAVVIQHYPFFKSVWGSGSREINCKGICFENERWRSNFHRLDLPQHMTRSNILIIRDLAEWRRWPEIRRPRDLRDKHAQLYVHNETGRFGGAPTACDSGRTHWPQILAALEGDDWMAIDGPTKGEFNAAFAFSLKTRELVAALGHGLVSVAQAVGAQGQDIDELQAQLDDQDRELENIRKVLAA